MHVRASQVLAGCQLLSCLYATGQPELAIQNKLEQHLQKRSNEAI